MWKDLRFSIRTLRRSPMFTSIAVASLALGIGANTAIFSLLDQVLLRSLPVRDPERLVLLHTHYNAPGTSSSDNYESVFSNPMYRDLRDRDAAFSGLVARMGGRVTIGYRGNADPATAETVSGNFFQVLGVGAEMGRVFIPDDDGAPGAHPVVVLSHSYWFTRLGASRDILNQTVSLNGQPMVVIGVTAAGFHGIMPGSTPDLYVPLAMKHAITPTFNALEDRRTRWLNLFARLKPGYTMARAQAATDAVYRAILQSELPGVGQMHSDRDRDEFLNHRAELRPAAQGINTLRREWEKPLLALMAMVGLVLLIACANLASLMLARASGRQKEIAIRLAMGASRWALVKQLLTEGLLLASAGGALALAVAGTSIDALVRLLPGDAAGQWLTAAIDGRLLGFTMGLALASGVLFALVPALQASRADVADTLKNQATSVASAGGPARFRRAVVTAQMALSLLLIVGAGLFSTSLAHLMHVDLGFRSERLLTFSMDATLSRPRVADAVAFYKDFQERLAAAPNVAGVAADAGGPFSGNNRGGNLTVEGYQPKPDEDVDSSVEAVSPGFCGAMRIPLRAGREFGERDSGAAPKVVLVNEAFVKRYFAGRDAVGRRLMFGRSNHPVLDREIVGVVADFRTEVREPAKETVYMPYAQWETPESLTFYVRGADNQAGLADTVRQIARGMDSNVPLRRIKPLTVLVSDSIYTDRLIALLSAAFGVLATLLAALGLYGVVAYAVARRTPEIGIRMALGALPGDVLRMVLKEAGGMAAAGVAIGLAGAWGLSRYLRSELFGVRADDPTIFAGAALVLLAVAFLAALVPGRRAARIDPMAALKYE
jgi:predicted permease